MDEIRLTIPDDEGFHDVAHLVVAGLGARLDLTVEAIEDLQVALDGLLGGHSTGANVTLLLRRDARALEAEVGPFSPALLESELAQEDGVGLQRVLATVADEFDVLDRDGSRWVRIRKHLDDAAASTH